MGSKKHKKHKSEKRDRYEDKHLGSVEKPPALKLILKVGSSSTPEHSDSPGPPVSNYSVATTSFVEDEEEVDKDAIVGRIEGLGSSEGNRRVLTSGTAMGGSDERHRRTKKKKKKRERDKHEKRHKRHHKEKRKHLRGGSSQEDDAENGLAGGHRRREGVDISVSVHEGGNQRVAPEIGATGGNFGGTAPSSGLMAGASIASVNSASSQHLPPPAKRPCLQPTSQGQFGDSMPPNLATANIEGSNAGSNQGQPTSQMTSSLAANSSLSNAGLQSPGSGGGGSREPRSCVLRQRQQERGPLQRLLEHLLRALERRDPHHFFAWPVTDSIAPGYSRIIRRPMDFSTMKQKIDEGQYATLGEYVEDFKLMCNNAMVYNHPDTIYYKAAKRLLHVGLRTMTPEKIRPLAPVLPSLARLTRRELGFELNLPPPPQPPQQPPATLSASSQISGSGDAVIIKQEGEDEVSMEGVVEGGVSNEAEVGVGGTEEGDDEFEDGDDMARREAKRKNMKPKPGSKLEAISDDMSPEDIIAQAKRAAANAAHKLSLKRAGAKMGFLRQRRDGTTSLAILIPGDGVAPGTNEKPVSLGSLVGKLTHGTGQLQGFREDRRNAAKTVKPLYYGSFGSYAPSYDSTFANLTKEESDLVYSTYGDETAVQYAESILDFAKDCDYALKMVDNLLDIVTGGEHRRTMRTLEEHRRKVRGEGGPDDEGGRYKRYLQEVEKSNINSQSTENLSPKPSGPRSNSSESTTAAANQGDPFDVKIDFEALKTLSDVGIDVSFLDNVENDFKNEALQRGLDQTGDLIGKLEQVQRERLSQPPPAHLALVPKPSDMEVQLAEKITENLTDMAKKVNPEAIAPLPVIRKAMGISPAIRSGKLATVANSSANICEEVVDEDEEGDESLPRAEHPKNSTSSVSGGSLPSDGNVSGTLEQPIIKSSDRGVSGESTSGDSSGMRSKIQDGIVKEPLGDEAGVSIKQEESMDDNDVTIEEKGMVLKKEVNEDGDADPEISTKSAVNVSSAEPKNILLNDVKACPPERTGSEKCTPSKDSNLFAKEAEIITKQNVVVGGGRMPSECIIGGNEDNVLSSIPVLGNSPCTGIGAMLGVSESKSNICKVEVDSGSLSGNSGAQGSLVNERIGLLPGSVDSRLPNTVTVSSHLTTPSSSLVRNSGVGGRGGNSSAGMSVVVVEAGGVVEEVEVPDLESELREFLENEPALGGSPLQDDKTIEEILSES
ncbi:uncharacterized protein LOC124158139 isoform X2 [Ischnura elegans]|uniref:uncharacterized protein LOC124158139 isoform X2 n=1 Tax=Ischnura elegans TaxID=197161 RepID=UPI001ED89CA8|nr:uncharacterized protein LOC124158139 isoform X2 [Ischnura elegans]